METNVLALDLGTKTGYAIYKCGCIVIGTKRLQHNKGASGMRFLCFRNWLIGMIEAHNISCVFFERVYGHKGIEAAHVYGAFMYILAALCEEKRIKCVGIPVGTIKKNATGKGNATKEDMMAFAKRHNFDSIDDNAADALAILFCGLNSLKIKEFPLLRFKESFRYFPDDKNNGPRSRGAFLALEKKQSFTDKNDDDLSYV
ncbi:MAG: crossover junction endodeoxyribonuclease RuvC [Bacteroidales bacterium]|jgi:Holliday junction resolvasome RuvABC endonuclease subunit|nr:crossover junction endodeoxyribonuclease RuvC [Bacteroidales bacterium]